MKLRPARGRVSRRRQPQRRFVERRDRVASPRVPGVEQRGRHQQSCRRRDRIRTGAIRDRWPSGPGRRKSRRSSTTARSTSDYFTVMRIPIRAGRGVLVAAIATTRRPWPSSASRWRRSSGRTADRDRPRGCGSARQPWMTVVGICGDVIHDWFDRRNSSDAVPAVGAGAADRLFRDLVRATGDPSAVAGGRPPGAARAGRRHPAGLRRDVDAAGAQRADDRPAVPRRRSWACSRRSRSCWPRSGSTR